MAQFSQSAMLILDFLVKRYRFKEEAEWQTVLCDKQVMLNGKPSEMIAQLIEGDEVLYEAPEAPEPDVDRDISVVFENEHFVDVRQYLKTMLHRQEAVINKVLCLTLTSRFANGCCLSS